MTAKVYVTLKKAVLDPQGKAVERSLAQSPPAAAVPGQPMRPRGPPGYRPRQRAGAAQKVL